VREVNKADREAAKAEIQVARVEREVVRKGARARSFLDIELRAFTF
jgi:hypothetical protein